MDTPERITSDEEKDDYGNRMSQKVAASIKHDRLNDINSIYQRASSSSSSDSREDHDT